MYIGKRVVANINQVNAALNEATTTSRLTRTKHNSLSRTPKYQIHNITAKYKH